MQFHLQDPSDEFQLFSPWDTPGIAVLDLSSKHCSALRAPKSLENIYCHGSVGSPKNIRAFATSSPKP